MARLEELLEGEEACDKLKSDGEEKETGEGANIECAMEETCEE